MKAAAFLQAVQIAPADARLAYEHDQLSKRIGVPLDERLAGLNSRLALVEQRDDLCVELASLLNSTG